MTEAAPAYITPQRQEINCSCGRIVFDKLIIRCRVIRVNPDGSAEGKCRCKRWNKLPLIYKEA